MLQMHIQSGGAVGEPQWAGGKGATETAMNSDGHATQGAQGQ
jgi:hypothetical protein